jgi:hypothetical protein
MDEEMIKPATELLERVLSKIDSEWLGDYDKSLCDDIKAYLSRQQERTVIRCCICKTTENVVYVGGYQAYRCPSPDCIPF